MIPKNTVAAARTIVRPMITGQRMPPIRPSRATAVPANSPLPASGEPPAIAGSALWSVSGVGSAWYAGRIQTAAITRR